MTALFEDIIFGPIHSRRLGLSLGVNLLPQHAKICNFDCVYCECGSNSERHGESTERRFAKREDVRVALRETLTRMVEDSTPPDVITLAGNGEPTLHPEFEAIIDDIIALRDEISPRSKLSVLSNAGNLHREDVVRALLRVDNNILKLDSAKQQTARSINRPTPSYSVERVMDQMVAMEGALIIQTMFLRSEEFDNTTTEELEAWLTALQRIRPKSVMIYSLDRDTPVKNLQRITLSELNAIAERVKSLGIEVSVSGRE